MRSCSCRSHGRRVAVVCAAWFAFAATAGFGEPRTALRLGVRYSPYRSYSQVSRDFPMVAGYPAFCADLVSLEGTLVLAGGRLTHLIRGAVVPPASVSSDDGTGQNYLLEPSLSRLSRAAISYGFEHRLFSLGAVDFLQGPLLGLLYEGRSLRYLSGQGESRRDLNVGIGPALALEAALGSGFALRSGFTGIFYLPYTSFGRLESVNEEGQSQSASYRPFTYAAVFELLLSWRPRSGGCIALGARKHDQIGFGGREPAFVPRDILASRMDSLHEIFLRVSLDLGTNAPGVDWGGANHGSGSRGGRDRDG